MPFDAVKKIGRPSPGKNKVNLSGWIKFRFTRANEIGIEKLVGAFDGNGSSTPGGNELGVISLPWQFDGNYRVSTYDIFIDYLTREERSRAWSSGGIEQRVIVQQAGYAPAGIPTVTEDKTNLATELALCSDDINNKISINKKFFNGFKIYQGTSSNFGAYNSADVTSKTTCSQKCSGLIYIKFVSPPATMPSFSFDDIPLNPDYVKNNLGISNFTLEKL